MIASARSPLVWVVHLSVILLVAVVDPTDRRSADLVTA